MVNFMYEGMMKKMIFTSTERSIIERMVSDDEDKQDFLVFAMSSSSERVSRYLEGEMEDYNNYLMEGGFDTIGHRSTDPDFKPKLNPCEVRGIFSFVRDYNRRQLSR
nr:hypothetical protein [Nanoarchaeum sp.]